MASNNQFAGNMFDIKPKTDIEIWALGVNTSSTLSETFDVYVREGGYSGYENNAGAWELWGSYSTTGSGTDIYTYIYPGTRSFEGGKTYGVYVDMSSYGTNAGAAVRYTNGQQTYENNYLRIEAGIGRGSGGFSGSVFTDRIWNGAIYYRGDSGQVQLATTMASNNQFAGNMFDVEVENDIVINSFDVNIDASAASGTAHVDVYMKTGSHVGSENDPFDWTYVGTDLAQVASSVDTYTRVSVGDIELDAGQTYSFYIHLASYADGHILRYTNGTAGDYVENSDMRIYVGAGKGNLAFTGSTFSNRQWNGRINYSGNHSGPHLWMADLAGNQTNHIFMAGCTPGARQYASWSVAGGGPQSSPWGTIFLSNPYRTLPWKLADSNGNVVISTFSPARASGLTVWVQSLDVGTFELTNGANLLIQ
jgi:hypothetical protein